MLVVAHEAEYTGWLTVERRNGNDRVNDMARAVKYVRSLEPG